jgi:hypothetical protein
MLILVYDHCADASFILMLLIAYFSYVDVCRLVLCWCLLIILMLVLAYFSNAMLMLAYYFMWIIVVPMLSIFSHADSS